jgi:hypothetical protein
MNAWNTLGAIILYLKGFFTSDVAPALNPGGYNEWGRHDARCARYAVYSAHYENTAYDDVHVFAAQYKTSHGLYRYTRGIYNPTKRLVDFLGTHLMGGTLDPEAGDGRETPSCLPILTSNENLRKALAILWRDSAWQIIKEQFCRLGPALGDVVLKLCDDVEAQKIVIEVIHPGTLEWADFDDDGCVLAYKIKESRFDPRFDRTVCNPGVNPELNRKRVDYVEYCYLDPGDGRVHYRTYLNNFLYPWNGQAAEWSEDYPFIPLIVHAHAKMDPKSFYGWPEIHGGHSKVRNLDDLASMLHDQIRKAVKPKWFFSGMADPAKSGRGMRAVSESRTPTADNPQPERQEVEAIYANGAGASATAMVYQLDIQFTSMEIQNASADLERDFPELRFDKLRASGDASAKALREARKPAEAKVHAVRAGYDAALVKVQKMAVVLGGSRNYPGYEGFGLLGLDDPALDHRIGPRSVFNMDPLDIIEEETAMLQAVAVGTQGGIPAAITLERCGWDMTQLKALNDARIAEQELVMSFEKQKTDLNVAAQVQVGDEQLDNQIELAEKQAELQKAAVSHAAALAPDPAPAPARSGGAAA